MGIEARAFYECAFYYIWGCYCGSTKCFGIGLDRDHSEYQVESWKLGYEDECKDALSVLPYARRTETRHHDGQLRGLSLRQFWR